MADFIQFIRRNDLTMARNCACRSNHTMTAGTRSSTCATLAAKHVRPSRFTRPLNAGYEPLLSHKACTLARDSDSYPAITTSCDPLSGASSSSKRTSGGEWNFVVGTN